MNPTLSLLLDTFAPAFSLPTIHRRSLTFLSVRADWADLAGIVWAFLVEDGARLRDSSALCMFWSCYNIIVLIIVLAVACLVCIEQPRYRAGERMAALDDAAIQIGDQVFPHRVLDISLGGARLAGASHAEPGAEVAISPDGVRLNATIIRCGADDFAVGFNASARARAGLIRYIYSSRFSASVRHIKPGDVAAAVLARVKRLKT
jgi:PilZ domain